MSSKNTPPGPDKARLSLGAKLITIISIILIISLGSFIALNSWLLQTDLKASAQEYAMPDGEGLVTGIEYDQAVESICAATKSNIYLSICLLCISIIIIWRFSKTISVPVKSQPDVTVRIDGGICKPEGMQIYSTVFFCDICDFSSRIESIKKYYGAEASEKIIKWLNGYLCEILNCVEKTGGVLDKFTGGAVMAHWSADSSSENRRKDAFNSVKAALMIRKLVYFLNKAKGTDNPGNPPIRIGCGINSGFVTAGRIGNETRNEYTVIGDVVNLASRLETLSGAHDIDIFISEETWKLTGDRFLCEELPSVTQEKTSHKPLRIFAVINFRGEPKGPQTLDDVRSLL